MHTSILSSSAVEKLKQKARRLRKDKGIRHYEALDLVAQASGFNNWHHVSESAKTFQPTEQAYYFGVIIAMDVKDAMDFRDTSGRFVRDDLAFHLCADDIRTYCCEADSLDDDPHYERDENQSTDDMLMNYVLFRYAGADVPERVDDVVRLVREYSFWPPELVWHKGTFQECQSNSVIDGEGKLIGIRF